MSVLNHKSRFENLDKLIRTQATGSPAELAGKLNVNERTVYRLIKEMKALGCPIAYDNYKETYYYRENGSLKFHFQRMPSEEQKKIKGGKIFLTDKIWQ